MTETANGSDVRRRVAAMRESAGIGRLEIERRCGFYKDSLRALENKKTPLNDRERRMLLGVLRVLCEAEGCDWSARMRRLRERKGLTQQQAAKEAGFACVTDWRRVECGVNKSAVLYESVRRRIGTVLAKWQAELADTAEAAE